MARGVEMRCGVPIWRVVATTDVTAREAQPQVHPVRADPEAILATVRAGRYFTDFFQMRVFHKPDHSSMMRSFMLICGLRRRQAWRVVPKDIMSALFDQILQADVGLRPQIAQTPLEFSPGLSAARAGF